MRKPLLLVVIFIITLVTNISLAENEQASCECGDHLFPVWIDKKVGYIDQTGKMLVPPTYMQISIYEWQDGIRHEEFKEGFAVVCTEDELFGYINKQNQFITQPEYSRAYPFQNGYGVTELNSSRVYSKIKSIIVNHSGETILRLDEGIVPMAISRGGVVTVRNYKNDLRLFGTMNLQGQWIVEPKYPILHIFRDGLAVVGVNNADNTGLIHGYINTQDEIVIKPQFYQAKPFSHGLAAVRDVVDSDFYFIDQTGKRVFEESYTNVYPFKEGLAAVAVAKKTRKKSTDNTTYVISSNHYGFIDKQGRMVIEPQFRKVNSFSEGLAAARALEVKLKDCKYGYIDQTGKYIIEPQFDHAGDFTCGLAKVCTDSHCGYINRNGKWVWKTKMK